MSQGRPRRGTGQYLQLRGVAAVVDHLGARTRSARRAAPLPPGRAGPGRRGRSAWRVTRASSPRMLRVRYQNRPGRLGVHAAAASGSPRVRESSTSRRRSSGSMRVGSHIVQAIVPSTSRSGPRSRPRAARNCAPTTGTSIGEARHHRPLGRVHRRSRQCRVDEHQGRTSSGWRAARPIPIAPPIELPATADGPHRSSRARAGGRGCREWRDVPADARQAEPGKVDGGDRRVQTLGQRGRAGLPADRVPTETVDEQHTSTADRPRAVAPLPPHGSNTISPGLLK